MTHDERQAVIKKANLIRAGLAPMDSAVIKAARWAQQEIEDEAKQLLADRVRHHAEVRAKNLIAAAEKRAAEEIAKANAELARAELRATAAKRR